MELLTIKNESMVSTVDPIAPLTNPLGAPPGGDSLSAGQATLLAQGEGSADAGMIGIQSPNAKNVVFLALVVFLIYKYGRKVLNA